MISRLDNHLPRISNPTSFLSNHSQVVILWEFLMCAQVGLELMDIIKSKENYSCSNVFIFFLHVNARVEEEVMGGHLLRYVQLTQDVGYFLGHMEARFSLVVKLRLWKIIIACVCYLTYFFILCICLFSTRVLCECTHLCVTNLNQSKVFSVTYLVLLHLLCFIHRKGKGEELESNPEKTGFIWFFSWKTLWFLFVWYFHPKLVKLNKLSSLSPTTNKTRNGRMLKTSNSCSCPLVWTDLVDGKVLSCSSVKFSIFICSFFFSVTCSGYAWG